jgi:hypothetical protein
MDDLEIIISKNVIGLGVGKIQQANIWPSLSQ